MSCVCALWLASLVLFGLCGVGGRVCGLQQHQAHATQLAAPISNTTDKYDGGITHNTSETSCRILRSVVQKQCDEIADYSDTSRRVYRKQIRRRCLTLESSVSHQFGLTSATQTHVRSFPAGRHGAARATGRAEPTVEWEPPRHAPLHLPDTPATQASLHVGSADSSGSGPIQSHTSTHPVDSSRYASRRV